MNHGAFQIEIPKTDIGTNKNIDRQLVTRSLTPCLMDWARFERHLMEGRPYSFNIIARKNGMRTAQGFQQASHIAMDSDKNATLAEILNPDNPLARHIRYIAPSPSDTPAYRKLRIIIPLAQPIYDSEVLLKVMRLFDDEFLRAGVRCDRTCIDAARWFFAKETSEIADFELNGLFIPASDYSGIIRVTNCAPFDLAQCRDFNGELKPLTSKATLEIGGREADKAALADLLEIELRNREALLERIDVHDEKVYCRFQLTHCFTSTEHAEKDHGRGAYSNACITIWMDGRISYKCYGNSCQNKGIFHFLRAFRIRETKLLQIIKDSTQRSNYTPQLLVPEGYTHQTVVNTRYLSDGLSLQNIFERLVIVDSPLGTGKTRLLGDFVEHEKQRDQTVLTVIPRRTLGTQAALRFDVVDYQGETREEMAICRSRTICVPSLDKLVDAESGDIPHYDVLIIDEPSNVFKFFAGEGQHLFNPESPAEQALKCFRVLRRIGMNAEKIVIAEACMDQRVAWLIRRLFDIPLSDCRVILNNHQGNVPVTLWGVSDEIRGSPLYADVSRFLAQINRPGETRNRFRDWLKQSMISEAFAASRKANIPVVIGCDELENGAYGIRRFLISSLGVEPDEILMITSETKEFPDVYAFLQDPNGYIETFRPKVILHTAAMETGFSIEAPCGVVIVADSKNHTLSASALLQMVGRCRNPAFIHVLLDERFRLENTDAKEHLAALITNHKALEAKHHLENQRLSADHGWLNEIHSQMTAETNRQRTRLMESVPALLEANGYDVHLMDAETMKARGCDLNALVGSESLQTPLAVRSERITRADAVSYSTPVSPSVMREHRNAHTVSEAMVAGLKKGKLLERTGAQWTGDEGDTLQLKPENAALFQFVEKSTFNKTRDPNLVPIQWDIENKDGYAALKKTRGFIIPDVFLEDRNMLSNEEWLSEVYVNNAVKDLKLHKPRNQRRFEAFGDYHGEQEKLLDWDKAELSGATAFRAFKDPRCQIVDYTLRLVEQIGLKSEKEGIVWIRGRDQRRIDALGYAIKPQSVLCIDEYIRTQFAKDSGIARSPIHELVRSHFGGAAKRMDNGDYLAALRQVLYAYFYRVEAEYNTPIRIEKLSTILPKISRAYEVKRTDASTYILLDPQDCIQTVNRDLNRRWHNKPDIETIGECLSYLNNDMRVDGNQLGLVWYLTKDERRLLGVPCRVYRSLKIDRALESKLLSLKDAPVDKETADRKDLERFRTEVGTIAEKQASEASRKTAFDQIESALYDADKPLSSREIADKIGLEYSDANKRTILRRLDKLLKDGKIAKTGRTTDLVYFALPNIRQPENGKRHSEGSHCEQTDTLHPENNKGSIHDKGLERLVTKSSFLYKEGLYKNDQSVTSWPEAPREADSPVLSGMEGASSGVYTLPDTVRYIQTDNEISDALSWLGNAETVGLDFETYGDLDIKNPRYGIEAQPRLLSISDGTRTVVFDCPALPSLADTLRSELATKTVICHNATFDLAFLHRWGVHPKQVIDTMIMGAVILSAEGSNASKSLKALCEKYLGETLSKEEQTENWSPESVPVLSDAMLAYSAKDAEVLIPLQSALHAKIEALGMDSQAYQIFCEAIPAFVNAKQVGMPIDAEKTCELQQRLHAEAQRIEADLTTDYGAYGYNGVNAIEKLKAVLSRAFGVEVKSTDEKHLFRLSQETEDARLQAFCDSVLQTRRLFKIAAELLRYKNLATDGRIFADFHLNGAVGSGRTSSRNPNLQQVSKSASVAGILDPGEVRRCFAAPTGYQFVIADYSQIELVLNAIHCGDEEMLNAFRAGADIHAHTASKIYGKPIEEISKAERQIGKTANFGLQYGTGAPGFQKEAQSSGIDLSLSEAKEIRQGWFASYPQIATHHSHVKAQKPVTVRTIAGRVLHADRVTQALSLPIQGSGADLLNRATAIIHKGLEPFEASIVAFVHDELVVLVKPAESTAAAEVVKSGMAQAGKDLYPDYHEFIRSEVKISPNWAGDDLPPPTGGKGAETEAIPPDLSEQAATDAPPEKRDYHPRPRQSNVIPIKDLSRDELVICIRELESELDETPAVIDSTWGLTDLQILLKSLEQCRDTGKARPVKLTPDEQAYL